MRHVSRKRRVLANGVVRSKPGSHNGLLDLRHAPGQPDARLEGLVPGKTSESGRPFIPADCSVSLVNPPSGLVATSARWLYFSV